MPITKARWFVCAMTLATVMAGVANAERFKNVVIISIDALHPDALKNAAPPVLQKLMDSGAYTLDGRSTEPPKTLIAHSAMFTGMSPDENGKTDNDWAPGQAQTAKPTIFNFAKSRGWRTGYFYSKQKLGYLVNGAVDEHRWSRDNSTDLAEAFLKTEGRHFLFLHVSGLDSVGPEYGWLSPEYLEELSFIDEYLSRLIDLIEKKESYLIIVTGDHAGHGRIHGSSHPQDYRLPFIVVSDRINVSGFQDRPFSVVDLKKIIEKLLQEKAF